MGAWGFKNFENDDAADFVWDVKEKGKHLIVEAINYVVNASEEEFEEEHRCEEALAAIEYLAAAKGNPSDDLPLEASEWVKQNDMTDFRAIGSLGLFSRRTDLTELSKKALERIRTKSELKDIWEESDEFEEWLNVLLDLEKRIS